MVSFEKADMEIFAHDLSSLSYFCRELGRPSGEPALARMIEDGVLVLCESRDLIDAAREIAHSTINTGPLELGEGSLDALRYGITDLAEALRDPLSSAQQIAIGNSLYAALTTFAFRAGGHWSASGKALPSALSTVRPALADQFTDVLSGSM
jgi:hypothetical protein